MVEEISIEVEAEVERKIIADTELIPPAGSDGVGYAIVDMMEQILAYRDEMELAERCVRYYKLRKNEHWKHQNKNLNLLSANLLGSHHQKTCNMLTDNNPTFNAVPGGDMGDEAQEKLSLLENITDSWWIDTEQQSVFEESVHVGELYGTVAEHVFFDIEDNFPTGEINTRTLDPLYVSLYPPRCRKLKHAEAVLTWEPMSVRAAKRKWPDVAEQLVGDMSLLEDIGDDREEESSPTKRSTQTVISSVLKWITGGEKNAQKDEPDQLFVITCWVKDYSTYEDGKPVYPGNIRRVRVANAGKVVLDDEYNPSLNPELPPDVLQENYLFNRFPHSYIQPIVDPASPFGLADFEQLEKLNIEFNKTMTQFAHFKDKTSRPKLLNPKDSGVTNQELDNMAGISRPTNHLVAQAIKYIDPPPMNGDILTGLNLYKDLFNEVAGSFNDVMQGQKQGSEVIAAKAIAMLLEEASRMARGKIRNYSKMLRERGRMFIAMAQMWYDTPRFVTFQKQGKEETVPVDRFALQIPGKINVVVGSTMPVSNIQRREEVLTLAQGGFVDQEYVLEQFNIDNYKDIIKRMQAGPLGQYLQKLAMVGIPQPILQLFQQIGQMDEKQLEKALKEGQIPQFMQIIQQMAGQEPPPNPEMIKLQIDQAKLNNETRRLDIESQKVQINAEKTWAEIQRILSEVKEVAAGIALTQEKTVSEAVDRAIRAKGVEFDTDNIKIQKARAVSDIKAQERQAQQNDVKVVSEAAAKIRDDKGGYDDRKIRSNNETVEPT